MTYKAKCQTYASQVQNSSESPRHASISCRTVRSAAIALTHEGQSNEETLRLPFFRKLTPNARSNSPTAASSGMLRAAAISFRSFPFSPVARSIHKPLLASKLDAQGISGGSSYVAEFPFMTDFLLPSGKNCRQIRSVLFRSIFSSAFQSMRSISFAPFSERIVGKPH